MKKFKRRDVFYVYILECQKGTYYTGYTNNLEKRLKLHNNGKGAKYLRGKGPLKLVWAKGYKYLRYAMSAEYKIKQLNRRQKESLINGMRLDKVFSRKK